MLADQRLEEEGGPTVCSQEPDFVFADAHLVRLDGQTGVCVFVQQLGGDRDGWWEDVTIQDVDEPIAEELFAQPRRRGFQLGRRAIPVIGWP